MRKGSAFQSLTSDLDLDHEIVRALEVCILSFNIESAAELERVNQLAKQSKKIASVSMRINPDIDAKTHPYIATGLKENKFGIAMEDALPLYLKAAKLSNIKIVGLGCHIGSQLTETQPFVDALDHILKLINELEQQGIGITYLNLGGGLGVRYSDEDPPLPAEYTKALLSKIKNRQVTVVFEPGRVIAANAGILLTRVISTKQTKAKNFAIVHAAMNDLLRPALYNAWQDIIPANRNSATQKINYDVVGPVCETGDFLGKDRSLAIQANDLLAIRSAGAYGFSMSSNYNSRCRAAEVMVDGDKALLIRNRELISQLFADEYLPL